MYKAQFYLSLLLLGLAVSVRAAPDQTRLAVWVNEAIVATYTYDYKNYLQQQKAIAKYFTAAGWTAYSKALNDSKLPETVQKNNYFVTAVATMPPEIKALSDTLWQATMPVLVVYKNPQYQQKQTLKVSISFAPAPAGQGVRGLAITSLQAKLSEPPCQCQPQADNNASPTGDTPQSPDAKQ